MRINPLMNILAHGGPPNGLGDVWRFWSLDPWIIGGVIAVVVLYIRGWRSLARRTERIDHERVHRAWMFAGGITALAAALVSPIDGLAEELFSMHMVQHNLLILVAAPLLVLSKPLPAVLLGLPFGTRRAIGRGWQRSGWLRVLWQFISLPMVAWLLQAGFLWAWHAPVLYLAALERDSLHALEHFSFLGSALLFWWVALDTLGSREQRGSGVLYLFTAALQGGLLGALLTFSPRIWYPIYAERAHDWGVTALADQQLAGTIMWVPSGLIYLFGALLLLKSWIDGMETSHSGVEEYRPAGQIPPLVRPTAEQKENEGA